MVDLSNTVFCFSMTMGSLTFYFSGLGRDFGSIGE
jgi:hypothetical protein